MKIVTDYRNSNGFPLFFSEGVWGSLCITLRDEHGYELLNYCIGKDVPSFQETGFHWVCEEEKCYISKLLGITSIGSSLWGYIFDPELSNFPIESQVFAFRVEKNSPYIFVYTFYSFDSREFYRGYAYALLKEEPEESEYYLRKAEEEWAEYERQRQGEAKMNEEKRIFEREYERRHKRHWWEFWKLL
ncbi:hypothetical protein BREVNS_0730 [Brevinematales bacterium NS]|nr:hypothetical protein BREVNS_0730 [Brevinematales bacterium NS]